MSSKVSQFALVVVITLFSLAFSSCKKSPPIESGIDDEEYRVMSAVLKHHRFGRLYRWYIEAPRFVDSLGRTSPSTSARPRKPHEFLFAEDTVRARSLLNVMNSVFGDATYYLAVDSQTVTNNRMYHHSDSSEDYLQANYPELLQDLHRRNQESFELSSSRFRDSLIVALVDVSKFKEWDDFYKTLPLADGIVRVSRVGFSTDGNRAVVYLYWSAAPLGGDGRFRYLEKKNGDWTVIRIGGDD